MANNTNLGIKLTLLTVLKMKTMGKIYMYFNGIINMILKLGFVERRFDRSMDSRLWKQRLDDYISWQGFTQQWEKTRSNVLEGVFQV